ncbi:hypothetical protein CHELA20_10773 [Hyphomicrobiales bacterium]|nr:hypothetical protein CHELA20_10773 [Hyphomicrobiales bacterium]
MSLTPRPMGQHYDRPDDYPRVAPLDRLANRRRFDDFDDSPALEPSLSSLPISIERASAPI